MATVAGLAHVGAQGVFVAALLGACGGDPSTRPDAASDDDGSRSGSGGGAGTTSSDSGASGAGGSGAGVAAGAPSSGNAGTTGDAAGAASGGAAAGSGGLGGSGASGNGGGGNGATGNGAGGNGDAGAGGSLAGAGAGGGASGSAGQGGSGGEGPEALSFAVDIWPMFDEIRDPPFVYPTGDIYEGCTTSGVCHGGQNPGADLHMPDAATAYDDLLNVPSVSRLCDETVRVVPGSPAESCLVMFYEGRLRDELDWVGDAEIDLVRRWIADGALP